MAFSFTGFVDEAEKQLDGQISVLKTLGWTAIETRLIDGKNLCDADQATFERVADTLKQNGISIIGFGSSLCNWARPITNDFQVDVDELARNIPRMQKVGAKIIRCMSYPNDKEHPLDKPAWRKEAARRLRELAKMAHDGGVILGHENCNGYGSENPEQFLELVADINSPAFKFILDTGNTSLHEDDREATWDFYQKAKAHIVHVHIKAGKPGDDGKYKTCYPDEDPMQKRILASLKADGYDGYLSIEPHMAAAIHAGKDIDADPDYARKIFIEYGKRIEKLVASL